MQASKATVVPSQNNRSLFNQPVETPENLAWTPREIAERLYSTYLRAALAVLWHVKTDLTAKIKLY